MNAFTVACGQKFHAHLRLIGLLKQVAKSS
jgi:hypothetical protein